MIEKESKMFHQRFPFPSFFPFHFPKYILFAAREYIHFMNDNNLSADFRQIFYETNGLEEEKYSRHERV